MDRLRLAVLVLFMFGCTTAKVVPTSTAPLRLTLSVAPQVGIAQAMVSARIRVVDEARLLRCPQFELRWGIRDEPSESSGFQGDYCGAEGGPRVHSPLPRRLALRTPGEYDIHATMADQGVSLHDRATVNVIGRTDE